MTLRAFLYLKVLFCVCFTCLKKHLKKLQVEVVSETCPSKSATGVKSIDITITALSNWLSVKSVGRDLLAEYVLYICFVLITQSFKNILIFWTTAAQLRMKSSLISGCPQWLEAVARRIFLLDSIHLFSRMSDRITKHSVHHHWKGQKGRMLVNLIALSEWTS